MYKRAADTLAGFSATWMNVSRSVSPTFPTSCFIGPSSETRLLMPVMCQIKCWCTFIQATPSSSLHSLHLVLSSSPKMKFISLATRWLQPSTLCWNGSSIWSFFYGMVQGDKMGSIVTHCCCEGTADDCTSSSQQKHSSRLFRSSLGSPFFHFLLCAGVYERNAVGATSGSKRRTGKSFSQKERSSSTILASDRRRKIPSNGMLGWGAIRHSSLYLISTEEERRLEFLARWSITWRYWGDQSILLAVCQTYSHSRQREKLGECVYDRQLRTYSIVQTIAPSSRTTSHPTYCPSNFLSNLRWILHITRRLWSSFFNS